MFASFVFVFSLAIAVLAHFLGNADHLVLPSDLSWDPSHRGKKVGQALGDLLREFGDGNDGDERGPQPTTIPDSVVERKGGRTTLPKVIHFTWKTRDLNQLPEQFASFQRKWTDLNPTWVTVIWSDEDVVRMTERYYPEWGRIMRSKILPAVVKADIFRYMVLYTFGGVYADMDVEPLKPVEALMSQLKWPACVLGQEPYEHAVLLEGRRRFLCNAVLVSSPGLDLWREMLRRIHSELHAGWMRYNPTVNPVSLSGPRKLTDLVDGNAQLVEKCALVSPEVFYPFADASAGLDRKCLSLLRRALRSREEGEEGKGSRSAAIVAEACRRVHAAISAAEEEEKKYLEATWAVHHWTHTWIAKHKNKFLSHAQM